MLNHLPTSVAMSEKTISCYCPFNVKGFYGKHRMSDFCDRKAQGSWDPCVHTFPPCLNIQVLSYACTNERQRCIQLYCLSVTLSFQIRNSRNKLRRISNIKGGRTWSWICFLTVFQFLLSADHFVDKANDEINLSR